MALGGRSFPQVRANAPHTHTQYTKAFTSCMQLSPRPLPLGVCSREPQELVPMETLAILDGHTDKQALQKMGGRAARAVLLGHERWRRRPQSAEGLQDTVRPRHKGCTVWDSTTGNAQSGRTRDRTRILGCWGLRRERWLMGWVTWWLGSHMMSQLKKLKNGDKSRCRVATHLHAWGGRSHRGLWRCSGHQAGYQSLRGGLHATWG